MTDKDQLPAWPNRKVIMAFRIAAGYGARNGRNPTAARRNLALGYHSETTAHAVHGLSDPAIADVLAASRKLEIA